MNRVAHVQQMGAYNQWMNEKLFAAAEQLPPDELMADKGAFFGSIFGTLNHIAVGDTIWLKRFSQHPSSFSTLEPLLTQPMPSNLKTLLFNDLAQLKAYRNHLDSLIIDWAQAIQETDLDAAFAYNNMQGTPNRKNLYAALMHFFNHQTHHRGQVTTLLSQCSIDVGDTDLIILIPNETP